jgi:hypothetical protein
LKPFRKIFDDFCRKMYIIVSNRKKWKKVILSTICQYRMSDSDIEVFFVYTGKKIFQCEHDHNI